MMITDWPMSLCQMMPGKVKKPGKRGRKPAKIDLKAKLERSRQSARECRARKKLRYQYLEELVSSKERAICALREELEMVKKLKHWNEPSTKTVGSISLLLFTKWNRKPAIRAEPATGPRGHGELRLVSSVHFVSPACFTCFWIKWATPPQNWWRHGFRRPWPS